ncbi:MAG: hypothetical protein RR145_04760 [Oscillospiraceae bacterium]
MKKYIKFVLLFLSMIAMLNLTVFAINTQNVFDTGLNILDAVGLCAAGLFVISLVFILVGLFTEKKQKQPDTTPNIIENNINKSPAPIEQPQDEESQEEQPQDEQSQAEQSQDEQPQDEEQEVEESLDEEQEP